MAGFGFQDAQAYSASVSDLNNGRQIVGNTIGVSNGGPSNEGYLSFDGTSALLAVPGAQETQLARINNAGQIVGFYTTPEQDNLQGFLDSAGTFTTIDVPDAVSTSLNGINDVGEVSGVYTDASGAQHGFTEAGGVFSDVTGPDGAAFLGSSINNQGQLIGTFGGSGLSYLATPAVATTVPEPASLALLGSLVALGAALRRHPARAPQRSWG